MASPLPDLSAPEWTPALAALLERASLAVGRLDARISASPMRKAWLERATWSGFAEARRAQGAEIDEIDVFALASGASLPKRSRLAFADDELASLRAWQRDLAGPRAPHWRELIPVTLDLPSHWGERPGILRALELLSRHARADRSASPWLGLPALLKALGVTRIALPCLVAADKALRLSPRDRDTIVPRYLKALARSAEASLDSLDGLEGERLRAAKVIDRALRPGKLVSLAALLQQRPLLTPLWVARTLRLSLSGAGKLLARAASEGLAVEISGRQAWKIYLTPDVAQTFGFRARPVGRPPTLSNLAPLDPILTRFDEEMATIDARLAELGGGMIDEAVAN